MDNLLRGVEMGIFLGLIEDRNQVNWSTEG